MAEKERKNKEKKEVAKQSKDIKQADKKKTDAKQDDKKTTQRGGRRNDNRRGRKNNRRRGSIDGLSEQVLLIRRLSKKTKGGNYISFSALVAVGDKKGKVGVGLGRGLEVPQAIKKGLKAARKEMVNIPIYEETIPHDIKLKYKSAVVILKPAPRGVGLKVGSVVRSILTLGGITNASGKILGTRNQITNAYAVIEALKSLMVRTK